MFEFEFQFKFDYDFEFKFEFEFQFKFDYEFDFKFKFEFQFKFDLSPHRNKIRSESAGRQQREGQRAQGPRAAIIGQRDVSCLQRPLKKFLYKNPSPPPTSYFSRLLYEDGVSHLKNKSRRPPFCYLTVRTTWV
ncbi:unnamed protein product [Nesidiocoris tenuis]|uniref:Uncharacterized protein n=1 Tax=Nesidiocoris tenuis TaxID=355587 RepID=A0A6H5HPN5_9HEMI|nr:unnamed protein product [Nesidiocoris tenuis]